MREAFGQTFVGPEDYLNSPTYGLPPQVTRDRLDEVHRGWAEGTISGPGFDADVTTARRGFADLAGVPVERVAMGSTVSSMLGPVAAAIADGSRVVVAEGEFTSVTFPFAAHADRGVSVREVPLDRIADAATEADVVAVATVQSADGARADVDALRAATAGTDTLVVLDATQQVGWLRLDLDWADVVAGSSYKWLMGPRGVAWAGYSPRLLERLVPLNANWYAGAEPWQSIYDLPLRLADDARRFDVSPAWFAVAGTAASLAWLTQVDQEAITAHCLALAARTRQALDLPVEDSAIVSIRRDDASERLERVGIRAAVRAGAARVGFHLYNTEDDVDRLVDALSR